MLLSSLSSPVDLYHPIVLVLLRAYVGENALSDLSEYTQLILTAWSSYLSSLYPHLRPVSLFFGWAC